MSNLYDAIDCAVIRLDDSAFYINLSSKSLSPTQLRWVAAEFMPRACTEIQMHFPAQQGTRSTLKNPKTGISSEIQEFTLRSRYCDESVILPCRQIVNRVMEALRLAHAEPEEAAAGASEEKLTV